MPNLFGHWRGAFFRPGRRAGREQGLLLLLEGDVDARFGECPLIPVAVSFGRAFGLGEFDVDGLCGEVAAVGRAVGAKPTWGYDYTTALRRLPSPSDRYRPTSVCINGTVHRHPKNRRRAVSYVSTGLACLPRDIDAFATTAEVRL